MKHKLLSLRLTQGPLSIHSSLTVPLSVSDLI